MVSAEHEREKTFFKRMLGDFREAAAGLRDFAQVLGVLFAEVLFFGLLAAGMPIFLVLGTCAAVVL